jgi:hypothetical protein
MNQFCNHLDSFKEAKIIGEQGVNALIPFLEQCCYEGRFVITDKGRISEFLQKSVGDIIFNCQNQKVWSIEVKTEQENKTGNLYLETWSNLSRYTPGWMVTLNADILWYFFQKERLLYSVDFGKLKKWSFVQKRIYQFPEKKQNSYVQKNDTWGRCVPIMVLKKEVGIKEIVIDA